MKRAREELDRCNVESRRLLTAILDEHNLFIEILQTLEADNSTLHGAVTEYCTRRRRINILHRISKIHALHGFTGNPSYVQRKGASLPSSIGTTGVHGLRGDEVDDVNVEGSDSRDDEGDRDMNGLVNFISHLAEV